MSVDTDANELIEDEPDLRPSIVTLAAGLAAVGLISAVSLPWPVAAASTLLGALMIAGADVDARTCLLPDICTLGAAAAGIFAAAALDLDHAWSAAITALARAGTCALVLALLRAGYAKFRNREGIGFGDVKLAAAVGAWLPLDIIPACFGLAAAAALVAVVLTQWRGRPIDAAMKVPFGAFLCPALWFVFYANALSA